MQKYKSLYKWMIIPLLLMQMGIFRDYWPTFFSEAWSVHIHYWTGTLWYLYLIIQPYYATHGQLEKHRTNGIIGMFLAGGVSITALSMLGRDIQTINNSMANPERFGPFEPYFFYGVVVVEIVMMSAFIYAIYKSIIHRKELENHAWWLISTVFLIMMPALGRGIQGVWIMLNVGDWPDVDILMPLYITQALIIGLLLLTAYKYKHMKHPATYLAVAVNVFTAFLPVFGKLEWLQRIIDRIIVL